MKTDITGSLTNYATKADLAAMETRLLKWFIGTAITLCGVTTSVAFTVARLIH